MKHLYKMSEWQSPTGKWYCNDIEDLSGIAGLWWIPARLLNIPLVDFVSMLVYEYNAMVSYNIERDVLIYSWDKQSEMRRFKNYINKKARETNFMI